MNIGSRLTTGRNCRLEAFHLIGEDTPTLTIGEDVQLNDNVHICVLKSVSIGKDALIASHVYISDNSHGHYSDIKESTSPNIPPINRPYYIASVNIGDRVWIGEGVMVLPGVSIGEGSIIGAHSVVNSDIPAATIAVGTPARVIKRWNPSTKHWDRCC